MESEVGVSSDNDFPSGYVLFVSMWGLHATWKISSHFTVCPTGRVVLMASFSTC